jgi:hypothetical protein
MNQRIDERRIASTGSPRGIILAVANRPPGAATFECMTEDTSSRVVAMHGTRLCEMPNASA